MARALLIGLRLEKSFYYQEALLAHTNSRPTVISTFAGAGGSSLGYQMAGYDERLAVEWDKHACEIFRLNFPDVPLWKGDIANLSSQECMNLARLKPRELDVLDGSPPCQGFSETGNRVFNDARNQLFKEYARLIRDLQPKAFVMENVRGMTTGRMGHIYIACLKMLHECGYKVKGQLLNAKDYGVPQDRMRLIIIGFRKDLDIAPTHPNPIGTPIPFIQVAEQGLPCDLSQKDLKRWQIIPPGGNYRNLPVEMRTRRVYSYSFRKLDHQKPSPTLLTTDSLWHPLEPRRLSLREKARIASFPDSFQWVGGKTQVTARIGNCVPPLFMKVIAAHIKVQLELNQPALVHSSRALPLQ